MNVTLQYPYVVEPFQDGWEVLFVRTDRPYRVAEFYSRADALNFVNKKNRDWTLEHDAMLEATALISRVRGRAAPHPFSVALASLRKRLRALLRLP